MKKLGFMLFVGMFLAFALVSCFKDDGSAGDNEATPAASETAVKLVSKEALTKALWTDGTDKDADAACLASSKFEFDSTSGVMIKKRAGEPTVDNATPVVVVASMNIKIAADKKGSACADGAHNYIVTASEEAPMDIATSGQMTSRQPLETVAKDKPTIYPTGCKVSAHFEKHGMGASCLAKAEDTSEEIESSEAESNDTDLNEAAGNCKEPSSQTIKLVIDSIDCTTSFGTQQGAQI